MNKTRRINIKLSIAQKLLLAALVNIILMACIGLYAIRQMSVFGHQISGIAEIDIPLVEAVTEIKTLQLEQSLYLERAIRFTDGGQNSGQDFDFAYNRFHQLSVNIGEQLFQIEQKAGLDLAKMSEDTDIDGFRLLLESFNVVGREQQDFDDHASQLLDLVGTEQWNEDRALTMLSRIEREEARLKHEISNLSSQMAKLTARSMTRAQSQESRALIGIGLLFFVAIVLGIAVSIGMTRIIIRPIVQINRLTKKVAQGNIDQIIDRIASDEIGDLATSINQLVVTLNQTADQADAISQGDFDFEIKPRSEEDRVGIALYEMKNQIFEGTRALEQSSSLNTGIVDTCQDAILTINDKGFILSCNKATLQLFGYSLRELIGQKINVLMPPPFSTEHDSYLENYDKTGLKKLIGFGRELIAQKKDGSIFPIALTVGEVSQQDNVVFTGFIRDISKQKEYESNLKRINADLKAQSVLRTQLSQINSLTQGADDLSVLAEAVIAELARMTDAGYGAFYVKDQQLAGQLVVMGSFACQPGVSVLPSVAVGDGLVGQCGKDKKPLLLSDVPFDYIQIRSGLGDQKPLNLLLLPVLFEQTLVGVIELAAFRLFSEPQQSMLEQAAEHIGIVVNNLFSQQQTSQLLKQTQRQAEALQAQQEELKSANENLLEQTQLLKVSEEELKQQSEELRVSNEELSQQQHSLQQQKRQIEVSEADLSVKAKELALASQYKSEFLANMSHELRTPLNSLLLLAKGLADNKGGNLNPTQIEDARIIHEGGHSLLSLINDILDLSKVEAGKLNVHIESMKFDTLTGKLEKMFKPVADSKGLSFIIEKADDLPQNLISDGQRVEQILRNLLSNAIKFTERGSVTLRVAPAAKDADLSRSRLKHQDTVALSIIDTGMGIPDDKSQQIFEAFQQQDGSTSRKFGGTGLGLTIAREMSRLLGGELQLTSKLDQGSTFTLFLPIVHQHTDFDEKSEQQDGVISAPVSAVHDIPIPTGTARENSLEPFYPPFVKDDRTEIEPGDKSLLIIDDDQAFAKVIRGLANKCGYKCLVAGDGHSGIYLAQQYQPRGILLDIKLPDIDGHQVLEQLKFSLKTRHIPVEVISVQAQNKTKVLQRGAIGLLVKPVSEKQLQAVLGKISDINSAEVKKVLIIEDDHGHRRATTQLLENSGLTITSVSNGKDGCAEILSDQFDCVILDLGLPDMSGFDVLKQVSADASKHIPPIIIYTGKQISDEEQQQLQKYASTIVIKGVGSPERLLDDISLFIHNIESQLKIREQQTIARLHDEDAMLQGRKILLADDDMRNTYALSKKLIEVGFDVEMANNGQEALELLAQHQDFELVLMDVMMPVMDGNQATKRIRQMNNYKTIPIIALTAKTMPEDRERCLQAGASEYITKPIDFERLLSVMRIWLFKSA